VRDDAAERSLEIGGQIGRPCDYDNDQRIMLTSQEILYLPSRNSSPQRSPTIRTGEKLMHFPFGHECDRKLTSPRANG